MSRITTAARLAWRAYISRPWCIAADVVIIVTALLLLLR